MKFTNKMITTSALIAAIYVVLTIALGNLSYGEIQFRISEVLVLLAFINPQYIIAVTLGTFIANLMGPFGLVDALVGSFATYISMYAIWTTRKLLGGSTISLFASSLWPVVINAIYVATLVILVDPTAGVELFVPIAISVGIGEFVVVSILGVTIVSILLKNKRFIDLF